MDLDQLWKNTQEELKIMMAQAGFEDVHYYNLSGGIVALHIAYKY